MPPARWHVLPPTIAGILFMALAASILLMTGGPLSQVTLATGGEFVFGRGIVAGSGVSFAYPTSLAFGPDGRLYVAEVNGRIRALTLDPVSKQITGVEQVASADDLQDVLGVAFDPTDASSPPTVYVSNTLCGYGPCDTAAAGSFPGKITKIQGPGYASRTDIITGLPVSNLAHQTNGLAFSDDGMLYIAQGGTTNAGLPYDRFVNAEVPLSGALLFADPSAPGFDGDITYDPPNTYGTDVDQVSGDVSVFASGLRNPYDLVLHSNGYIYMPDNGPNLGGGPASTGCDTPPGAQPGEADELNLVEAGNYYGHPNPNRGRADPRQCVYHERSEGDGPDWTGPIENLPVSSNGILEYTADTFDGALQGDLFYVSWVENVLGRIVLSPDGRSVVGHTEFASDFSYPLDVAMDPDGTLYVAEYYPGNIVFLEPDQAAPSPDSDDDGCTNKQELGDDPYLGGQRNPDNFWDFFDVPTGVSLSRDGSIASEDIFGVIGRFNATDVGPGDFYRDDDALSTPNQVDNSGTQAAHRQNYHPAYDRGAVKGSHAWDLGPPDGAVASADIFGVISQFGHSCD